MKKHPLFELTEEIIQRHLPMFNELVESSEKTFGVKVTLTDDFVPHNEESFRITGIFTANPEHDIVADELLLSAAMVLINCLHAVGRSKDASEDELDELRTIILQADVDTISIEELRYFLLDNPSDDAYLNLRDALVKSMEINLNGLLQINNGVLVIKGLLKDYLNALNFTELLDTIVSFRGVDARTLASTYKHALAGRDTSKLYYMPWDIELLVDARKNPDKYFLTKIEEIPEVVEGIHKSLWINCYKEAAGGLKDVSIH